MMRSLATVLAVVVAAAACDTSIQPMSNKGEGLFAMHGYLDATADTQYVRVEPLRAVALGSPPSLDGVRVYSTLSGSGVEVDWIDSTGVSATGESVHLYYAVFRPEPGGTYRVVVERNGAEGAIGSSVIPTEPELEPFRPVGDASFLVETVALRRVESIPDGLDVVYYVLRPGATEPIRVVVDYGAPPSRTGSTYSLTVFLSRDRATVAGRLGYAANEIGVIRLVRVAVESSLVSRDWASSAQDPGITLGRGFLGARAVFETSWRLAPDDVVLAGFVDAQPAG